MRNKREKSLIVKHIIAYNNNNNCTEHSTYHIQFRRLERISNEQIYIDALISLEIILICVYDAAFNLAFQTFENMANCCC